MSDKKEITEEEANKLIMGSGSGKTREVQSGMERILGDSLYNERLERCV